MISKVRFNSMIELFGPNWFLAFSHKFTKVGVIKLRISLQLTHNFRLICHISYYLVTLLQKITFTSNLNSVSRTFVFSLNGVWTYSSIRWMPLDFKRKRKIKMAIVTRRGGPIDQEISVVQVLCAFLYVSVCKATVVAFWVWKSKLCPSYSNLCKLSKDSIWNSFEVIDFGVFKGLNLCFVLFIMCNIWESDLGLYN